MYLIQYRDRWGHQVGKSHSTEGKEDAAEVFLSLIAALPVEQAVDVVIRPNSKKPIRCHRVGAEPGDREFYWKDRVVFPPPGRPRVERAEKEQAKPGRRQKAGSQYNIYLRTELAAFAASLGGGSLSRGLASLIEKERRAAVTLPDFED